MRSQKYYLRLFYFSVALLLAALLLNEFTGKSKSTLAADLGQQLDVKLQKFNQLNFSDHVGLRNFYLSEKSGIYVYVKDSLVFWNNSRLPYEHKPSDFEGKEGIVQLRHGLYFFAQKAITADSSAILLSLLKPNYSLQNNYLSNDFEKWTGLPKDIKYGKGQAEEVPVQLHNQNLFYISGTESLYHSALYDSITTALYYFAILLLTASILFLQLQQNQKRVLFVVLSLVLVRAVSLYFQWPAFIYRSSIYDLRIFGDAGSTVNAYLGDMLMNSAQLAILTLFFRYYTKSSANQSSGVLNVIAPSVLALLSLLGYGNSLKSLVDNSTIRFDLLNAINLQLPLLFALSVLCLYGLAFFLSIFQVQQNSGFKSKWLPIPIIAVLASVSISFNSSQNQWLESMWPFMAVGAAAVLLQLRKLRLQLSLAVFVLFLALLTSQLLRRAVARNENKELELLSYRLSERADPMLESEFGFLPERLNEDGNIKNLLRVMPAGAEGIELQLRQHYFTGYFDRYQIDMQLFDPNCNPLLLVSDGLLNNSGYFDDIIHLQSDSTACEQLFFVRDYQRNTRYVAKINLGEYQLFLRMDVKQYEELGTFPDLLLDRSQQKQEKLSTFSHAVYRTKQIASQYGGLSYPLFLPDSAALAATYSLYQHHYYYPDQGTVIVISEKTGGWREFITSNSYLLLFFALLSFFCFLFYSAIFTARLRTPSLTRRIQSTVIVLLLVSMSAIGYTSASLVRKQFEDDNKQELEEKTQIILAELGTSFNRDEMFDESRRDLINLKLREYARLFNTPVSLFDASGFLFTTSEEKLYDLGLAAKLINPLAFDQISNNRRSAIPVTEKAGSLSYVSFYTPVLNKENKVIGYINLPYFARQSALLAELSGIVSALVNVYVLLFVLSLIAGLILSGYITQPLRLIQQQIAKISLGTQNEKISWSSKDEIGKLVDEYNAMLLKLEASANLLAQSERESAWREMAKQVAHEIKNPLTPMKLNLQYLQHVVKSNDEDFKEKFNRSAAAIIEQIDALASIATEFSNFARLPSGSFEAIDLQEVVATAVQLFSDESAIHFTHETLTQAVLIKGDREQCLRIFNNLIKNAVQACTDTEAASIKISYELKGDFVELCIADNGCGIDAEQQARIFEPNFTTKSTGSGLGLSMVKNIVEGFGGTIRFESRPKIGTSFYIRLPILQNKMS